MNTNIIVSEYSRPAWCALKNVEDYARWRDKKLENYPASLMDLQVEVTDPQALTTAERKKILARCSKANMVLLACSNPRSWDKHAVKSIGLEVGLRRLDNNLCADEDAISNIQNAATGRTNDYIPYTDRPLSWHTDGYYNAPQQQIRAWILFCIRAAADGGENSLLDPELAYIHLRDREPALIHAFMAPDAMTVPANIKDHQEIRPICRGPVFSFDVAGQLHMRFSARARNIHWKEDAATQEALECLCDLFLSTSPHIFHHRLEPGEAILSNNVLHNRSGFADWAGPGEGRLLLRARYFDRIQCK